ncbi:MAG: MgtC/SapB family protein [Candidatus Faecousia sp.]|nr:MgtC/SapB family protein [Candidatus Faecousia sp.]
MLTVFASLRALSMVSVAVRMCLAVLCGGMIGLERTYRRRPAGFRTHMLICLGAAITTLTSQFLVLYMGYYTDMARIGAQVVAGIGFIGAGTIIVTRHQRVKGLTTAAGLWAAAIVGLALGAGFYEGGLTLTVLVMVAELVFSKVERLILHSSLEMNLYLRYDDSKAMERVLCFLRDNGIKLISIEVTRPQEDAAHKATAIFLLRLNKKLRKEAFLRQLYAIEGVSSVEVLSC